MPAATNTSTVHVFKILTLFSLHQLPLMPFVDPTLAMATSPYCKAMPVAMVVRLSWGIASGFGTTTPSPATATVTEWLE